MRDAALPIEFSALKGQVSYVQKRSHSEYSSSCPDCGGSQHQDGSFPDRFVMLLRSRATGGPLGFCRKCGFKWWEGKDKGSELTQEQRDAIMAEREQIAIQEREEAEHQYQETLRVLRTEKIWETYHQNLTDETRLLWRRRGIPDSWQNYWSFGYCPDFKTWTRQGEDWQEWHTPTLTIPVWGEQWSLMNIRHRLLNPMSVNDKYRPDRAGLHVPPFIADPDIGIEKADKILVLEGEIKAAVTYIELDDPNMQVIGMVGMRTWENLIDKLSGKTVWICLDPDAQVQASEMARQVKGRIISLPVKIDDAIVDGSLTRREIQRFMRYARAV